MPDTDSDVSPGIGGRGTRRPGRLAGLAAAVCLGVGIACPAPAQEVQITSPGGEIRLSGTVLGFDGRLLRLDTEYGALTVDMTEVTCTGRACPSPEGHIPEIRLSGAPAVGSLLLPTLLEIFARDWGLSSLRSEEGPDRYRIDLSDRATGRIELRLRVHLTSTEEGLADLVANVAEVAMAVRAPRPEEAARIAESGAGDLTGPGRAHVLALDAVVPAVSPANPVRDVSPAQLGAIWSGTAESWAEFGGRNDRITVYQRASDGFGQAFADSMVPDGVSGPAAGSPEPSEPAAIARDPGAVGPARFTELRNARPLALAGACGRRMSVTETTIATGDYPMTTPLMLYLPERRQPDLLLAFLRWTRTPAAELVVRRLGLIDPSPREIPLAVQGERLANAIRAAEGTASLTGLQTLLRDLDGASRLSPTFRFRDGTARLDTLSQDGIVRLVRVLEKGTHAGRDVLVAGFSDGTGGEDSQERADRIREALVEALPARDPSGIAARGYGTALPNACDDTEIERRANRRVEVWLR